MGTRILQVLWLATIITSLGLVAAGIEADGDFIPIAAVSLGALAAGLAIIYITTGSVSFPKPKTDASKPASNSNN